MFIDWINNLSALHYTHRRGFPNLSQFKCLEQCNVFLIAVDMVGVLFRSFFLLSWAICLSTIQDVSDSQLDTSPENYSQDQELSHPEKSARLHPTQKVVSSQWPVNMRVENSGPLVLGWELWGAFQPTELSMGWVWDKPSAETTAQSGVFPMPSFSHTFTDFTWEHTLKNLFVYECLSQELFLEDLN